MEDFLAKSGKVEKICFLGFVIFWYFKDSEFAAVKGDETF